MTLDTRSDRSLWKDRALVELNAAVLHSFAQAGVAMVDHHTVARQFMLHQEREMKAGRTTNADWSWIVPPLSGSTTPSSIEIQLLLQPICDEGRIPQLPTLAELIEAGEASGFAVIDSQDCTQAVSRTWGIILQRMIRHLLTNARYRAFLVDRQRRNRIFALTALRIWLARSEER